MQACLHGRKVVWVRLLLGFAHDGIVVFGEEKIQRFADKALLRYAFPLLVPGAEAKFLESCPVFGSEIMGFGRFVGSGWRYIANIA